MNNIKQNPPYSGLTATEVSNIWSAYLKSTMEMRLYEHFYDTAEDPEIKDIVKKMLDQAQKSVQDLLDIFKKEQLSIPQGFTEDDVREGAQKAFSDTFLLYICQDLTLLSLSTSPSALSDSTRKDVRQFFQENIEISMQIQNELIGVMLAKGVYLAPPQVAINSELDFVDSLKYLNGILGGSRPVNAPEIANLARVIHRAQFSKMVFVSFNKLASTKKIQQHFSKGRDEIEKVLDALQKILEKENIPISASGDYLTFNVEFSPFSDKLLLFFVNTCLGIFCFNMINQALTSSLRSDIVYAFEKIAKDMKRYYGQGLLLAINEKWFEQPPQAIDRRV